MNVFEKDKIDQSIYNDFVKEIEMTNARIVVLEKNIMDSLQRKEPLLKGPDSSSTLNLTKDRAGLGGFNEAKINSQINTLIERVNTHIDHLEDLKKKGNDLPHIKACITGLQNRIPKEVKVEKMIHSIQGFIEYFNDQWNKFNISVVEHGSTINKLEREKIIAALDRLKTPRDALYEIEIDKWKQRSERLNQELSSIKTVMGEIETAIQSSQSPGMIDLNKVVRSEILRLQTAREEYEAAISYTQTEANL